jgi:hypothetical protein
MTIAAETNRVTYSCNGVLTDFAFSFKIFAEGDLKVTVTDSGGTPTVLTITTDYTVAGENGAFASGGTVTTVKEVDGSMGPYAWATGYTITIELDLDLVQEIDLVYGGTYSTQDIERMADRLTKICQQLNDAINRSVVLSTASELSGLTIPDLIAGRYLYAADAETLGWAVSVDTTALTVSDWAKTLLDDVNAAAALGTLGLSAFIKTLIDDANAYTARKTLQTPLNTVVAAKTAAYEVLAADDGKLILADATTINIAIALPAVGDVWNGFTVGIKKVDSGSNYVESTPDGAEKIDGENSHFLRLENSIAWYVVDGTGWKIVANTEITGDMCVDALKDPAAATAGLRTLGTGAAQAAAGNQQMTPSDASVTQAKLKTSQGSVSGSPGSGTAHYTLPGGEYGFYPQIKTTERISAYIAYSDRLLSYATRITFSATAGTAYAQQRYVTSSGEVFWIFILRTKYDEEIIGKDVDGDPLPYTRPKGTIISMYQAPDHPCFGNGGKPLLVPHPFGNYDPETQEIIVINPSHEEVEAMKKMGERGEDEPDKDLLEVIMEEYEIDENSRPAWPTKAVTVGLPKDYETKNMGDKIANIKKVIPKMDYLKCKSLKRK